MDVAAFYAERDPLHLPLYTYAEAARIVRVPATTVRYWIKGGSVTSYLPTGRFEPVLQTDVVNGVSFTTLIELQIIRVLREYYRIPMANIREAHDFAAKRLELERPLMREILVGGKEIFVKEMGVLVGLNRSGQVAITELLEGVLDRVEYDTPSVPHRFFPFVPGADRDKSVQVAPRIRFGVPTVRDTAVPTAFLAARVDDGEEIAAVAGDHDLPIDLVHDAVMFEAGFHA